MTTHKLYMLTAMLLIFTGSTVQAQYMAPFAIIKDKDGYVNVHAEASKDAKVIDKLLENQLFEDQSQFGSGSEEWVYISYGDKKSRKFPVNRMEEESVGYIHKSRVLYLDKLPQLKRKIINPNQAEFQNDTLKLVIKTGKFIPQNHTIEREDGYISKVDNIVAWGVDGSLDREAPAEIKSITITHKNRIFPFPKEALTGMFCPNFENMYVVISNDNTLFVVMSNSDAAGAYNVAWTIQYGKVVSQFMNRDF